MAFESEESLHAGTSLASVDTRGRHPIRWARSLIRSELSGWMAKRSRQAVCPESSSGSAERANGYGAGRPVKMRLPSVDLLRG